MNGKKIQSKSLKNIISNEDMAWLRYNEYLNNDNIAGDERLAYKSAHSAHRFKENMVYAARKTNINTWKKQFEPELKFHSTRCGWWEYDHDDPLFKK